MADIVKLGTVDDTTLVTGEPCRQVVERLEQLLAEARAGNIVGLVYGVVKPGLHTHTSWASDGHCWGLMGVAAADLFYSLYRARDIFARDKTDRIV